jgi:S1-C subfamily serine protease
MHFVAFAFVGFFPAPYDLRDATCLVIVEGQPAGSGTVVYADRATCGRALVLTAHHVIANPDDPDGAVEIEFPGGRRIGGNVVAADPTGTDLAAIILDASAVNGFRGVAKTAAPAGALAWQLGYTGGTGPYHRRGVVEGTQHGRTGLSFLTDGGDSGSGVFDLDGNLIAVVCWKRNRGLPIAAPALAVEHARVARFVERCRAEFFAPPVEVAPAAEHDAPPARRRGDPLAAAFLFFVFVVIPVAVVGSMLAAHGTRSK